MLQQTQVSRVRDYYSAWMKQYPSWRALAKATNAQVIRAWSGLGYNRRALALRDMARHIVNYGEPRTETGWRALKGIGPYTAAAIMAFAFGAPTVPIDTNVRRVAGRWLLGVYFPSQKTDPRIRRALTPIIEASTKPAVIPQALFDLASSHCGKTPNCAACPLRSFCVAAAAFQAGTVRIPKQSIKKSKETIRPGKTHPDRIYRGRILRALQHSPQHIATLGRAIDPSFTPADQPWLLAMLTRMERDRLVHLQRGVVRLEEE
jgi:A/G-specific adenine glycosylase